MLLALHPPPLVDLLRCCFDQLPGALHQFIEHDVKPLVVSKASGVLEWSPDV